MSMVAPKSNGTHLRVLLIGLCRAGAFGRRQVDVWRCGEYPAPLIHVMKWVTGLHENLGNERSRGEEQQGYRQE
jgi:hypothetical protein